MCCAFDVVDDIVNEENSIQHGYMMERNKERINGCVNVDNINTVSNESPSTASNLTALDPSQRLIFQNLLKKFGTVFSDKPGCAIGYEHYI